FYLATALFAQDAAPTTTPAAPAEAPVAPAAAPIADTDAQPPQAEYGGPAILTRGGASSLRNPAQSIRFRPFLAINGTYDTGITPISIDDKGRIPDVASYGGDISAGLLGYHAWKKSSLGVDYRGDYRHYSKNTYYNGADQTLQLVYHRQSSRKLGFTLREAAGLYTRASYGAEPGEAALIDPNFANVPPHPPFANPPPYPDTPPALVFN